MSVLVLDFGSQVTQLIARRVREAGVYCEIVPFNKAEDALAKNFSADAIKDIKVPSDGLNADIHGSAEYRAHLVNVMAQRAVAAAK